MSEQTSHDRTVEFAPITEQALRRGGGVTLLAGVLVAVSGLSGVVLAAIVGGMWMRVRTPYTVAVGQLLYAVWAAEPGVLGVVGILSFGILFIPELFEQWRRKTALLATSVLGVASVVFAGSLLVDSVPLAAFGLCLGFGTVSYSIHRYELVRFGLVELNP
jgi:hypothetical protein